MSMSLFLDYYCPVKCLLIYLKINPIYKSLDDIFKINFLDFFLK